MALDARLSAVLSCPNCHGELAKESNALACISCGTSFAIEDGIPLFVAKQAVIISFDYVTHYVRDSEVFDYFEERHGATAHSERRIREYTLSLIPKRTQSILDVGCGSAWVAKALQNSGTWHCSLDISIENPRKALQLYPSPNHVGVVGDSFHLPFRDSSFDAIIAAEIIEHLHDPKVFAAELLRVVKPGGAVVISTPYKEKLVEELCIHCHQLTPHNAHLHSWNESKLRALFGDSAKQWNFVAFNNKVLVFARTYPLLQWMPFVMWKRVDRMVDRILKRPANCVFSVSK